jgi:hypothetical protein
MQTGQHVANVGSRLKRVKARKAPSEKPAFQPYRGKPAVRNDRGDRGNVGIIRSPVRASILPDQSTSPPICAQASAGVGEASVGERSQDVRKLLAEEAKPLTYRNAMLQEKAADLIDHSRSLAD